MAKINIPFNGVDYLIDESALAATTTDLQSHLQTEMSGTGAVIKLGGNAYNVDSTKLTTERNAFVSHLGTIAGTGSKVMVNGTEYGVDSNKTSVAVAELETVLGDLSSAPDNPQPVMKAAGLYQTGTDTMVTSWDDLIADGTVHVDNGVVYTNFDADEWVNNSSEALAGDLVLPDDGSITAIGDVAYDEDWNLSGHYGFTLCENLTGITIPNSVTTMNTEALGECFALTRVVIGNSVEDIPPDVFHDCESLVEITVDEHNPHYCSIDGNLYSKDKKTLIQYAKGKPESTFTIPDSVTSIGDSALSYCTSLTSIVIPDSVTAIGYGAFNRCIALTSITIPDSVTSIGDHAFSECWELMSVEVPNSVTSIGENTFRNGHKLTSIVIPDSVTSIGMEAFYSCWGLTSIVIGGAVATIEEKAFDRCSSLTNVYYKGTEAQWNSINIAADGNSKLTNATITYNYQG